MSILDHLDPSLRPDEELSKFKSVCCQKYTVDVQCKRCPFRQIDDLKDRDQALHECFDKRRGTYRWKDITIEYNNQYN